MAHTGRKQFSAALCTGLAICMLATGCASHQLRCPPNSPIPRELSKASIPDYVIEPPDILLLSAVRVVPLPPYHIEPLDALMIQVTGIGEGEPQISGVIGVDPDGTVNLGATYGTVKLVGLTLEQAKAAI